MLKGEFNVESLDNVQMTSSYLKVKVQITSSLDNALKFK